ncbi:MAG: hypothetical protein M1820_005195 [Bogoriella megaspora]|nr:MAG: hypothetical protein M1820_005195 [Bogoriella megaspora]
MDEDRKIPAPQAAERPRPEDNSRAEERPKKRQKVPIACEECRVKKTKCDGNPPICNPCRKRQGPTAICKWDLERDRTEYVKHLEDKVRNLQRAQLSENHNPMADGQALPSHPSLQRSYSSVISGDVADSDHAPPAAGGTRSDAGNGIDKFEGVNAMMGAVNEPEQGFFGSSSAASFIKRVKTAIDAKVGSPEDWQQSPAPNNEVQLSKLIMPGRTKKQPSGHVGDHVLPLRKIADTLLDVYWVLVDPLYPFLDKPETVKAYESIWTGDGSLYDETTFLCILNAIFALCCQLSETIQPEQREASADVFFERAKDLLNLDLWQDGSIQSIQCLLIMGQYLQSTNDPHRCWIVIGLAVRSAQAIGLHLPSTSSGLRSPKDRQLARKVWHGCVLMDRALSMTFGRPQAISRGSPSRIPLPVAVDDEYIPNEPTTDIERLQPGNPPSKMWFFLETLHLYSMLNDILHSFHEPESEDGGEDIYEFFMPDKKSRSRNVFDIDKELTGWTRNLPVHLKWPASESWGEVIQRQANVLHARYLHTRILLYRPILSRFCTSSNVPANNDNMLIVDDALPLRVALQCSIICVKTAQEQINVIHDNTPVNRMSSGPLPAWWYNILYVYTAATVLVAARLRSTITAEISEAGIRQSWSLALEVLRRYQTHSISAQRCVAALEILYDKIPSQSEMLEQQQRQQQQYFRDSQAQNFPTPQSNTTEQYQNQAQWSWMGLGPAPGPFPHPMAADAPSTLQYGDMDFLYHPSDMSWLNSVPSNL